jgi:hypothetical protein
VGVGQGLEHPGGRLGLVVPGPQQILVTKQLDRRPAVRQLRRAGDDSGERRTMFWAASKRMRAWSRVTAAA